MACSFSGLCISTGVYPYDGQYSFVGVHNGEDYFSDGTYFVYYSTLESRWCLSNVLDGTCLQFGPTNSFSNCPDFDESFFISGVCPTTTTTTTSPCDIFDFEAIFDCLVPTTTTTTTTIPPTTTTTTTLFNPCLNVDVSASITAYTTTTTTIPVTTTTTTVIDRPCNFDGNVQFNIFDEYMRCGNSKIFRDCLTGIDFYTSDVILTPIGVSPIQNYVYKATVNGVSVCLTFLGLVDTTSGIDNIVLIEEIGPENENGCLECIPNPPPTTTTTSTSTTTTTTKPPCILSQYIIVNQLPSEIASDKASEIGFGFSSSKFVYTNCEGKEIAGSVNGGQTIYICSATIPTGPSYLQISDTGIVC
jgi:hypothetical protein